MKRTEFSDDDGKKDDLDGDDDDYSLRLRNIPATGVASRIMLIRSNQR
jgi:hypothetical protein